MELRMASSTPLWLIAALCYDPVSLRAAEAHWQETFARRHMHGEWYALTKTDISYVQSIEWSCRTQGDHYAALTPRSAFYGPYVKRFPYVDSPRTRELSRIRGLLRMDSIIIASDEGEGEREGET
jgi:hypothetical protein